MVKSLDLVLGRAWLEIASHSVTVSLITLRMCYERNAWCWRSHTARPMSRPRSAPPCRNCSPDLHKQCRWAFKFKRYNSFRHKLNIVTKSVWYVVPKILMKLLANKRVWLSSADAEDRAGDLALPFDTLKYFLNHRNKCASVIYTVLWARAITGWPLFFSSWLNPLVSVLFVVKFSF